MNTSIQKNLIANVKQIKFADCQEQFLWIPIATQKTYCYQFDYLMGHEQTCVKCGTKGTESLVCNGCNKVVCLDCVLISSLKYFEGPFLPIMSLCGPKDDHVNNFNLVQANPTTEYKNFLRTIFAMEFHPNSGSMLCPVCPNCSTHNMLESEGEEEEEEGVFSIFANSVHLNIARFWTHVNSLIDEELEPSREERKAINSFHKAQKQAIKHSSKLSISTKNFKHK